MYYNQKLTSTALCMDKATIIIPVKDEEVGLQYLLDDFSSSDTFKDVKIRFIFVIDGRTSDNSREVAEGFSQEIIDQKENFRRVIDLKKNSGWIHISQLRKLNSLIVTKEKILFKNKSKFSEPLVKLNQGRLVLISKCVPSWCKVKTGNYRGWISLDNVWGM